MTRQFGKVFGVIVVGIVLMAFSSPASAKFTLKDTVGENETKLQFYGFTQLEARGGEGAGNMEDGIFFKAQRIRWGANYGHCGPIKAKLFLDFNQSFTSKDAGLPKVIKDAFIAYRYSNEFMVRMGMIKTPLGMDFTVPGWNLDIIERQGLEKGLVLERDFGLIVSGRLIGQDNFTDKPMKTSGLEMGNEKQGYGFGYDFGVFNPAGRSSAVKWDTGVLGEALAFVGRVHFDYGKMLHIEGAYGVSQQAGGLIADDETTPDVDESAVDTEDYTVFDVGVSSEQKIGGQWVELKGEFIAGENIKGVKDTKQNCIVGTVGVLVHPNVELVGKHYMAKHETASGVETDLANTYLGVNIFPFMASAKHRDLQRHKIVVNYVLVSGDDMDSDTPFNGVGGYCDPTFGLQWQIKY